MNINDWIRIPTDMTTYDESGNPNGKLGRTCGVKVLEKGERMIRVFSPDLNKVVYLRQDEIEKERSDVNV